MTKSSAKTVSRIIDELHGIFTSDDTKKIKADQAGAINPNQMIFIFSRFHQLYPKYDLLGNLWARTDEVLRFVDTFYGNDGKQRFYPIVKKIQEGLNASTFSYQPDRYLKTFIPKSTSDLLMSIHVQMTSQIEIDDETQAKAIQQAIKSFEELLKILKLNPRQRSLFEHDMRCLLELSKLAAQIDDQVFWQRYQVVSQSLYSALQYQGPEVKSSEQAKQQWKSNRLGSFLMQCYGGVSMGLDGINSLGDGILHLKEKAEQLGLKDLVTPMLSGQ